MHCRSLENESVSLKALVYEKCWTRCYGEGGEMRYSYNFSKVDYGLSSMMMQSGYVRSAQDLLVIKPEIRATIDKAFRIWESIADIRFVEDNVRHPDFHILAFQSSSEQADRVKGFSTMPLSFPPVIGFNARYLGEFTHRIDAVLHELGHMMGLNHPFESKNVNSQQMLTSFSIMNYQPEISRLGYPIEVMTPMPADYDAAQFIWGANKATGTMNDTYYLRDYPMTYSSRLGSAIATLPWDNSGTDTLSSEDILLYAVIDIRVHGKSLSYRSYVVTPNITIENVIAGNCQNAIVLNDLNNNVNINQSTLTHLYLTLPNIGSDVIEGFQSGRDRLIFSSPTSMQTSEWKISADGLDTNTTFIDFGGGNNIRLLGVSPAQFSTDSITLRFRRFASTGDLTHVDEYKDALLIDDHQSFVVKNSMQVEYELANIIMKGLTNKFISPFACNVGVTGSIIVLNELVNKLGYQRRVTNHLNVVARCLPLCIGYNTQPLLPLWAPAYSG